MFDMKTIILVFFINMTICTAVMISLWVQNRRRFAGLSLWLIAIVIMLVDVLALATRNNVDYLLSIMISNGFYVVGMIILYAGLQKFYGIRLTQIPNCFLLVSVVVIQYFFTVVDPDITLRNIVFNTASLLLAVQCAWLLQFKVDPEMRRISKEVSLGFWGLGIVSLLRILENIFSPSISNDFFAPGIADLILMILWGTSILFTTIFMVLVVNRRLAIEAEAAEKHLKTSEEKYRGLVNNVPLGIIRSNPSDTGQFLEVNPAMEKITGYGRDELLNMSIESLNVISRQSAVNLEDVSGYNGKNRELLWRRKDGKEINIRSIGNMLKNPENRFLYMDSIVQDITEQKRMELDLRKSEAFNSTILTNASNPILVLDMNHIIRYANPAFEKLTGFQLKEVTNEKSPFYAQFIEKYPALEKFEFPQTENVLVIKEIPLKKKNAETFWISASFKLIISGKDTKYCLANWVDITERKIFEQELTGSREQLRDFTVYLQERIEEEKKQLSAEIHDELGQSLTAMEIELSILNRNIPPEYELLRKKAVELTKLIQDTGIITKNITAGLRPPSIDSLGLVEALRWISNQFQSRTGIKCEILIDQKIILDKDKSINVFRIVQESLTNITRHAKATHVTIKLMIENGKFILTIRDNGRGITDAEIANNHSFGLIGMGERAYKMGAHFTIKGLPGAGTAATLIIPYQEDCNV